MRLLLGLVLFLFALCTPLIGEDLIDEKPVIKITIIEDETQGESEGEAEADSESRDASATAEEIDKREIPENAFDANDTSTKINENTTTALSGSEAWSTEATEIQFRIFGFLGMQSDNLDWTVKLSGTTEKTSWKSIQSMQAGLSAQTVLNDNIYLYLDYQQALDHSGDVNNTLDSPPTDISGSSDDGDYQRYSLGFSYRFTLNDHMWIGPRLGFFESDQKYQIKNSSITAPSVNAVVEGLDSRFETTWNGMLIGGEYIWQVNEKFSWSATLDLSLLDYAGAGRLNLRPDLKRKSFTQSGDGIGIDLHLACTYQHSDQLGFHGFLHYADWNVDGSEKRYPSTGGSVKSTLDEAHFTSLLFGGGVSYAF